MAQGTSEHDGQSEPFLEHMSQWIELIMSFNMKMHNMELGPADGKLYMQGCDLLTAHAKRLERMLDEDGNSNTSGEPPSDAQSQSDRPSDPAT